MYHVFRERPRVDGEHQPVRGTCQTPIWALVPTSSHMNRIEPIRQLPTRIATYKSYISLGTFAVMPGDGRTTDVVVHCGRLAIEAVQNLPQWELSTFECFLDYIESLCLIYYAKDKIE